MEKQTSSNSPQNHFDIPPANLFEKIADHLSTGARLQVYLGAALVTVALVTMRWNHIRWEDERHAFASRAADVNAILSSAGKFNVFNPDLYDKLQLAGLIQSIRNSNDSMAARALLQFYDPPMDRQLDLNRDQAKIVRAAAKLQCERADSLFK